MDSDIVPFKYNINHIIVVFLGILVAITENDLIIN